MVIEYVFLYTAGHPYSPLLIVTASLTTSEAGIQVPVFPRARYVSVSEGPVGLSALYCVLTSPALLPAVVCLSSLLLTDSPCPAGHHLGYRPSKLTEAYLPQVPRDFPTSSPIPSMEMHTLSPPPFSLPRQSSLGLSSSLR